tara:strand:+ start:209 stop:463 length:255 start_codon:yes stop_codon:yes gene_type:complete
MSKEELEELLKKLEGIKPSIIQEYFDRQREISEFNSNLLHSSTYNQNKDDDMRIECLIGETYQVTDGSTVWFQGRLSDCKAYLN